MSPVSSQREGLHVLLEKSRWRDSWVVRIFLLLLLATYLATAQEFLNLIPYARLEVSDPDSADAPVPIMPSGLGQGGVIAIPARRALRIEWDQPRSVHTLILDFQDPAPRVEDLTLEWWRRIWPDNGEGGWMKLDDPFNGRWTKAQCDVTAAGKTLQFRFRPLGPSEAPGVQRTGQVFRHTYKLRLVSRKAITLTGLKAHSEATLARGQLRFEWDAKNSLPRIGEPSFQMRHGRILETKPKGPRSLVLDLEYGKAPDRLSPDRGHVVFRNGSLRSFSVFVDDVLAQGGLWVRDIGVFVSDASLGLDYASWTGPAGDVWPEGTVTEQVSRLPEQSFAALERVVPTKPSRYLFLGVPYLRQEIALSPSGDVILEADSLRSPGPDQEVRPWTWDRLLFQFRTESAGESKGVARKVERRLEEGWLPVAVHTWTNGSFRYEQASVATPLMGDIRTLESRTGTETVVLATRFRISNQGDRTNRTRLALEISPVVPFRLAVDGTMVLHEPSRGPEREGYLPVRGRWETHGRGDLNLVVLDPVPGAKADSREATAREAVGYDLELGPGQQHAVDLFVPYVELLDPREFAALKDMRYEPLHDAAVAFWRERIERGMTYEVPDRYLNELFRANLWHVLISTDIDPQTGHYQHGAATHGYLNYLNETAMVAQTLEMRGEHEEAGRLLQPFLANQGVKGLPGNFRSTAGVLYAAHPGPQDPYTAQGYNMHHGWGTWFAAEHYRWQPDISYLQVVAPQLVAAADWITQERKTTRYLLPDGTRPVEYGLAPAGDLEDVEEYLYFYATDAYYHLGLKSAAETVARLAELRAKQGQPAPPGEPSAAELKGFATRLQEDATRFREDILLSVDESVATSPVVRLRDGSYVPFVPHRVHALTHRKEGWIREGLYPALHLVAGKVLDPTHPYVDWMIQDLEDNIFLSAESGYGLADPRKDFYHFGGMTLQPALLDLALVYLQRDQIPNFLRAFYNTAWASLYPDAACFAEWIPRHGEGSGPLYKTPDESKFIQWMRAMLILEAGDTLQLGAGVPLAWMQDGKTIRVRRAATYFGKVDLEIVSKAAMGQIEAEVRRENGPAPKRIRLRLRHPDSKPLRLAEVNGRKAVFDAVNHWIELPPGQVEWRVKAFYGPEVKIQ